MSNPEDASSRADFQARLDAFEQELTRLSDELVALRLSGGELPPSTATSQAAAASRPAPPPPPTAPAAPVAPRPVSRPAPPPKPPRPPSRTLGELARDWDLMGARGFAIAGGAVMALGIGLFFVLATNRGWIDEKARVGLGAAASALVVGAGLVLRAKYGQYLAALAAVGAGIAGAYATLAAAAARYDLVPDALALPLAGVIAAVATFIALQWRSQIIAAIGLLGAALAPALQAIDAEMTWESAAFAVIVAVAAATVSVPRGWRELLVAATAVVGLQVEWLLLEVDESAGVGDISVAAAFVLALLGISVGLQLVRGRRALDPIALPYALAATGSSYLLAAQVFGDRTDRGIMLFAASAVWALVFAALHVRRFPDLALVVGVAALALAAVASADLLSDAVLTLAFSAQAVVLAVLADRLRDVRLQVLGFVYATLAGAHAIAVEARIDRLFDEDADQLAAALPLAAVAVAWGATGALVPTRYVARTESGLLAFVAEIRTYLSGHRSGAQEALLYAAAAFGTLAAAFFFVSISFDAGHVAASLVASAVGAGIFGAAARRESDLLAVAGYYWLGVVLVEALMFDVDSFPAGGWSALAGAAGLLAGGYLHRLASPAAGLRDAVFGVVATIAALAAALAIGDLADGRVSGGLGLAAAAFVYVALAATVFQRTGLRDVATVLWALALLFVIGAELLLVESLQAAAVVVAVTGGLVALLSTPLEEVRLWFAGGAVVGTTTLASVTYFTPPSHFFDASEAPAAGLWALLGCIAGLVALAVAAQLDQHRFVAAAVAGGLALYAASLGILDIAETISTASVETDFERGHTAVSALWALVGLGLLVAGLLRGSSIVRYGGLVLFAVTLAKIFLYDLAELSSVARAFSFIFVGALLLAGGFFLQRLSERIGPRGS